MARKNAPIWPCGYCYDTESGFYYLQSRYYDPVTYRFINADAPELSEMTAYNVSDSNMFAYCGNNPVIREDDDGEFLNVIAGAVIGVATTYISDVVANISTCTATLGRCLVVAQQKSKQCIGKT